MQILNIAGYKFTMLDDLDYLKTLILSQCQVLQLKGTVLLSSEGINISLAGQIEKARLFIDFIKKQTPFKDLIFHETFSKNLPFQRLKVKTKKEIITFHQPQISPVTRRAPALSPQEFKHWMDEKRDITILDTRNDFEINFGTFSNATNLQLKNFTDFVNVSNKISNDKPIVMFCTGGIRCEKAALYLIDQGFSQVYQLDGGILGYFKNVGGEHFNGECFVFDERVKIDASLKSE